MNRKMILVTVTMLMLTTLACRLFAGDVQPLAAEAPTNAPPPPLSSEGDACIVGTWALKDFEQYMTSIIPSEITSTGELTYDGTSGRFIYTFTGDNRANILADEFTVRYQMKMGGLNLPMEVNLDGSGSADYTLMGGQILLSNVDSASLFMSINLAGASMMPPTPITGLFPGSNANSAVGYTCDGNTLTFTLSAANSAPVTLERTSP